MIYLNIILTILTITLISLVIFIYLFYKKFKSSVGKVSELGTFNGLPKELKEPMKLKETLQFYNSFMEELVKKK